MAFGTPAHPVGDPRSGRDPVSACDLLREAGEALYGPHWQSPLARDLGMALRTMQRYAAGSRPVPPGLWPELYRLLSARATAIPALMRRMADDLGADDDHNAAA